MWTTTRLTDEFINEFFSTEPSFTPNHSKLAINVHDDVLGIGLLVPGHSAETLSLEYESDKIIVKSTSDATFNKIKEQLILPIEETLRIGKDWNGAKAEVTIKDGILYISIPKFEERKPKKLTIKVG